MANCELTTGILLECKDAIGGIKSIVLADWSVVNLDTVTINATTEIVTALPVEDFYGYQLPTQTGSFEETINFNRDAGTIFYTQTVNVMLQKLTAAKRLELQGVATSRVVVFVNDTNNNWWAVGLEYGADLSTSTAATGTVLGDANGFTLAFTHESPKRAYLLAAAPSPIL
jgi:hypothetical protein